MAIISILHYWDWDLYIPWFEVLLLEWFLDIKFICMENMLNMIRLFFLLLLLEHVFNISKPWALTVIEFNGSWTDKIKSHVSFPSLEKNRSGRTFKLEKLWRTLQYCHDSFLFLLLIWKNGLSTTGLHSLLLCWILLQLSTILSQLLSVWAKKRCFGFYFIEKLHIWLVDCS